jgi:hypothetical protein
MSAVWVRFLRGVLGCVPPGRAGWLVPGPARPARRAAAGGPAGAVRLICRSRTTGTGACPVPSPAATTTMEHRGGQNNGNAPSSWSGTRSPRRRNVGWRPGSTTRPATRALPPKETYPRRIHVAMRLLQDHDVPWRPGRRDPRHRGALEGPRARRDPGHGGTPGRRGAQEAREAPPRAVPRCPAGNSGEDSGYWEAFVHHGPPNSPGSPDPPR